MKNKLTIGFAIVLIVAVIGFMVKDFFFSDKTPQENPYEYNLDNLKNIPEDKICYNEVGEIISDQQNIRAIDIDENDNIYIAGINGVEIYNSLWKKKKSFPSKKNISCIKVYKEKIYLGIQEYIDIIDFQGNTLRKFNFIDTGRFFTSIAIIDSSIFIADAGNKLVYHLDLNGHFKNRIGLKDTAQGIHGFIIPSPYFDLAIGRENQLWVVNPGRHAFEAYNFEGQLISRWAKTSMQLEGFSGCCNPSNFAILSDGSFVTSEKGIERVKIHSPDGKFKCVVATPQMFTEGTKGIDLAVDSKDRIYVLDPKRNNIRIFERKNNE